MKNLGIILVILGALGMIGSYFAAMSTNNGLTAGSFAVCVIGLLVHIFMNKKYA